MVPWVSAGKGEAPSFLVSLLTAILGRWTSIFFKRQQADPFDQGTLVCPGWDWLFRISWCRIVSIDCIIGTEQFLQVNWNQFLKVPSNGVLTFSIAVPWMISPYILVTVSVLSWRCGGVSCKACWHWHVYLWAQAQRLPFVPQLYGRCGVKRPCDWPDESPHAHAPMSLIRWQHLRTY